MKIEDELNQLHPAEPSAAFDQRMKRLFTDAEYRAHRWYRNPIALWQCAALCALAFAIGLLLRQTEEAPQIQAQEPTTTIYYIEGNPEALRRALGGTSENFLSGDITTEIRIRPALQGTVDDADSI